MRPTPEVASALTLTRFLLRRPWHPGERNFCKPSNWANNLIPVLTQNSQHIRPLFIAIESRDYLVAMFRGGRERVEYTYRATRHLLGHGTNTEALWADAMRRPAAELEVAARVGLISLHHQFSLFKEAMRRGRWSGANLLSLRQIEDDPVCACMVAAQALGVEIGCADIIRTIEKRASVYAKAPDRFYSREARRRLNAQIERAYGQVFDQALEWAAGAGLETDPASILPPSGSAGARCMPATPPGESTDSRASTNNRWAGLG